MLSITLSYFDLHLSSLGSLCPVQLSPHEWEDCIIEKLKSFIWGQWQLSPRGVVVTNTWAFILAFTSGRERIVISLCCCLAGPSWNHKQAFLMKTVIVTAHPPVGAEQCAVLPGGSPEFLPRGPSSPQGMEIPCEGLSRCVWGSPVKPGVCWLLYFQL